MFDEPSDEWAKELFTEQEIIKLKQAAKDIHAEVAEAAADGGEWDDAVSFEMYFQRETATEFVSWLKDTIPTGNDAIDQWLAAIGAAIAFAYLVDENWDMDEVMSDHAVWFGAADMFFDTEEVEDDDD